MSWTVTINGHYGEGTTEEQRDMEARAVETLRAAAKELNATSAWGGFQHHGSVNLLAE